LIINVASSAMLVALVGDARIPIACSLAQPQTDTWVWASHVTVQLALPPRWPAGTGHGPTLE